MEKYLDKIILYALERNVTDIHFYVNKGHLTIYMRNADGMFLYEEDGDLRILEYLRFISNMDMSNSQKMQSGACTLNYSDKQVPIRFSYISTTSLINGALRILEPNKLITIANLSYDKKQNRIFKNCCKLKSGLVLLSGATGSGKTTTLYTLIDECIENQKSVFTIEDPIEVIKQKVVQLQIQDSTVTYEMGLKQILRHDPDVIMVGEIRDKHTAKMVIRCALTGHLVFSTIHASSASGVINRLLEFGISKDDLRQVLSLVCSQRLIKGKSEKICIYDMLEKAEIERVIDGEYIECKLDQKVLELFNKNLITKTEFKKQYTNNS